MRPRRAVLRLRLSVTEVTPGSAVSEVQFVQMFPKVSGNVSGVAVV